MLYDEMCCCLTRSLMVELKDLMGFQKPHDCVDFYSLKPLNSHTWPDLAAQCLCALLPSKRQAPDTLAPSTSGPGNKMNAKAEVNRAASFVYPGEGMAACVDILVIMSYHPLFYLFMRLEADDDVAVIGEKKKQRDFSTVKRKVAGSSYKSHIEFASDVR